MLPLDHIGGTDAEKKVRRAIYRLYCELSSARDVGKVRHVTDIPQGPLPNRTLDLVFVFFLLFSSLLTVLYTSLAHLHFIVICFCCFGVFSLAGSGFPPTLGLQP